MSVVVVGAGAVGSVLALLLHKHGLEVTLVDPSKPASAPNPNQSEPRVFALSEASLRLLGAAGVELTTDSNSGASPKRTQDYTSMQVRHSGAGELNFCDSGQRLGVMVEAGVLAYELEQACKSAGVKRIKASVEAVWPLAGRNCADRQKPAYQLKLSNQQALECKFLVAADGRRSKVRAELGMSVNSLNYNQVGLSFAASTELPHELCARQQFGSDHIVALLPMSDLKGVQNQRRVSVVWCVSEAKAHDLKLLSQSCPEDFINQLETACGLWLGRMKLESPVLGFPLSAQQASSYTAPCAALVGDCAHGVHPLAGQGLNLGLLDAAVLSEQILAEFQATKGELLASSRALYAYESVRKPANELSMHAFSALSEAFKDRPNPLSRSLTLARSEVLSRVSSKPKLLDVFIQSASGLNQLEQTRWAQNS